MSNSFLPSSKFMIALMFAHILLASSKTSDYVLGIILTAGILADTVAPYFKRKRNKPKTLA